MQVSVENLSGIERKLTIEVPADNIESAVKERLRQISKSQKMDGFRKGKVPLQLIQKRYGAQVHQEVLGETIQHSFYQALMQEKINPAGNPVIEDVAENEGGKLKFVAIVEVYPEIELKDLSGVSVEKIVADVTDADLDKMLETLRKQQGSWAEVEREAAQDDQVVINFVGSIDGEKFEGGAANDFPVVLGAGTMIPGFEDGLLGTKAGDKTELDVQFPEDYQAEQLAGKAAKFDVEVVKVNQRELPELDDTFAERFGVTEGGVDKLKADVRANMARELEQALKSKLKSKVFAALLAQNEIQVPKALINNEIASLRKDTEQRYLQSGVAQDKIPALKDEVFTAEAERRVKLGLLVAKVVDDNKLEAPEDRINATIEKLASAYEHPQDVIDYYKSNKERSSEVSALVVEDMVVETLLSNADIAEVTQSFDDVMNPSK